MANPFNRLLALLGGKCFAVFHGAAYHPTATPTLAAKPDVGWTTRSLSTFANTELSGGKASGVFHGAAYRTTIICEPHS